MRAKNFIFLTFYAACFLLLPMLVAAQNPGKQFYLRGENFRKQHKYQEAIDEYEKAIKEEPDNFMYHFREGICYYRLNQTDLAISAFQKASTAKPEFTGSYLMIGKIYRAQNDLDNSIQYYNYAFQYENDPEKKVKYKMLVVGLLMKEDRIEEAAQHVAEAKAVAGDDPEMLYYDAKINNQLGNYEVAKTDMLLATQKIGDAPPAQSAKYWYELGYAYQKLNDYQNAKKALEKANFGPYANGVKRLLAENSPAYYYKIALGYYFAGDYDNSKAQINKALELQSDLSAAFILLGKIAKKQGDYPQAVNYFLQASESEKDPKRKAKLYLMVNSMQIDSRDYNGAISSANQLLQIDSRNVRGLYNKAVAQYYLGQYSSTMSTLDQLLSIPTLDGKSKAQFNFIMGLAAKNSANTEKAKEAFRAAMYGPFKAAAKNELDNLN